MIWKLENDMPTISMALNMIDLIIFINIKCIMTIICQKEWMNNSKIFHNIPND